jgi:hypothetical protein
MANEGAPITQELGAQHAQNEPIAKDGETVCYIAIFKAENPYSTNGLTEQS